jgi:hypothetical protein
MSVSEGASTTVHRTSARRLASIHPDRKGQWEFGFEATGQRKENPEMAEPVDDADPPTGWGQLPTLHT